MPKPLSRPYELGRAIGYKIDPCQLLQELKRAPREEWGSLGSNRVMLDYARDAAAAEARAGRRTRMRHLWLVVKLENGVPVLIDAYTEKGSANRREKFLRQHMRDGDAVNLIQIELSP